MESPVLVDSRIFIGLLRQGIDPSIALPAWSGNRDLAVCGMVRMEVIRGVRDPGVRDALGSFLDTLKDVPSDRGLWREAAALAWKLDRAGTVLPAQDLLIAASALRLGGGMLTDDQHFRRIPGIRIKGGLREITNA